MATRRTIEFLDGQNIKYTVVHHSPAFTAQEVAATTHIPGRSMAKTVVVDIDGGLALAVLPATRELDMTLLRSAAEARYAAVAEKQDFADRFEGCQLGTMPPLGILFGLRTYVDSALAKEEFIAFNAGSHSDVIVMRFVDYRRIAHPRLAEISAPIGAAGPGRFAGIRA